MTVCIQMRIPVYSIGGHLQIEDFCLICFSPVNTIIKVMLSQSVNLSTLFLRRLSKGNGSFRPLSRSLSRFALSRFAPESFRPSLRESFCPPTLSRFAHYLMSRLAHFLNLYFIEDIVKNLQFLFPSIKILLYFFKK